MSEINMHVSGLRDKRGEVFLGEGWKFDSIEQVFTQAHRTELINKIPEHERFNIYFTAAKCWPGKGRKFGSQDAIPFDIDKLFIPDDATEEETHALALKAATVACEVLGVSIHDVGVIFSGNGVWVWIWSTHEWSDEDYFRKTKVYYDDICKRITDKLKDNGLVGTADTTGWGKGKICRMPDTDNVKPGKPRRTARVLSHTIKRLPWRLEENCPELKHFEEAECISAVPISNPDVDGVLAGCEFLKNRITDHGSEPEVEWYARAGIYAFFPRGKDQLFHDHSKQHHAYERHKTEFKLEQARAAQTGPRKCKSIEQLTGNKYCIKCAYYQKHASPLQIVSDKFIKTESTGFWRINKDGVPSKISFDDLVKAFSKEFQYTSIIGEETIMIYNGTHWEEMPEKVVKAWMNDRVKPSPSTAQTHEFFKLLQEQPGRLKQRLDFDTGTFGKMNFKNCVLDFKTMTTHQHSSDYLFTHVLPYAYDPQATAPTWEKFVKDVASNDEDALTLKQFAGWAVSGDDVTKRGRALILVGTGSNGKSVYTETLQALMGEKNITTKPLDRLISKPFTLYWIMYSLLNISSEGNPEVFKNTDVFKQLTNGERVTAEKKGGAEYDFKNRTKIVCSMNHPFKVYDDSHGFRRRILFIRFTNTFVGKNDDKNIQAKLNAEIPGIINSVIKAYRDLLELGEKIGEGLPFASINHSETIMNDMAYEYDSVAQFVDHKCDKDDKHEESTGSLHTAYVEYCRIHNIKNPKQIIAFVRDIRKKYSDLGYRQSNGKSLIKGLRLWDF